MTPRRPLGTVEVIERTIPGRNAPIPVRLYGASGRQDATDRLLVWVHGGGFAHGDLDMPEADWVARRFAASGIRVLSVGYRLIGGDTVFPAPADDVADAIVWATTTGRARHVFAGGASAGANLVTGAVLRLGLETSGIERLLLAYPTLHARQPLPDARLRALLKHTPEPEAFGPANLLRMYAVYVGGDPDDAPVFAVPGTAPPTLIATLPPVTIVAAESDELRLSAEMFTQQIHAAGGTAKLYVLGAEHGFLNNPNDPAAETAIEVMLSHTLGREQSN